MKKNGFQHVFGRLKAYQISFHTWGEGTGKLQDGLEHQKKKGNRLSAMILFESPFESLGCVNHQKQWS